MFRAIALLIVSVTVLVGCGPSRSMTGQPNYLANRIPSLFSGQRLAAGNNAAAGGQDIQFDPKLAANYQQQVAGLSQQLDDLNTRLSRFNTDNQDLHSQIALLERKLQLANDYSFHLKQQLGDTAAQLQTARAERQRFQQQSPTAHTSGQGNRGTPAILTGAATIRANNSLMARLPRLQIDGVTSRMDGDVIRVEIPSDSLFVPQSYQIQGTHTVLLGQLASVIRSQFPEQIVGIEAHWDHSPIGGGGTSAAHQLTATQALAVFDQLVAAGLPPSQLFTMGLGSNRLRYSGRSTQNRRVEIVIYPERFADE